MAYYSKIAQDAPVYKTFTQAAPGELASAVMFNSDGYYEIDRVILSHSTAGTDAGAVNIVLRKWEQGEGLASGVSVTTTVYNLKGAINTPTDGIVVDDNKFLSNTDRLGILATGTMTTVAGVNVTVRLKRVRPLP